MELTRGEDELLLGTRYGMAIRFLETDIRNMGRASMGVKSIELDEEDYVISLSMVEDGARVLSITTEGYGKQTEIEEYRVQSRGGKGILAMRLTEKTGLLAAQLLVTPGMDLMLITDDGTIIRTPADSVSVLGRNTQGVRLMRVGEGAQVISVALAEPDDVAGEGLPEDEELEENENGQEMPTDEA